MLRRASGTNSCINPAHPDLRKERDVRGKSKEPIAAVLAALARFQPVVYNDAFFTDDTFRSILFTLDGQPREDLARARAAGARKQFEVVELHAGDGVIDELVRVLHDRYKVRVLLVEGGSTVNGSFIRAGYGDHFFLTESPRIAIQSSDSRNAVSGPDTLLLDQFVQLRLESAFFVEEFGGVFQHWRFAR